MQIVKIEIPKTQFYANIDLQLSAIVSYRIISRAGRNTISTVTQTRNQAITGFPGIGLSFRNNSNTEGKVIEKESEEEDTDEEPAMG